MILKCDCHHLDQDDIFGYGKRYHNKMLKENMYRCTVCGKERSGSSDYSKVKEVKK